MGDEPTGPFDFSQLVPEEFRLPKRPGYDAILAEARRLAAVHGEYLTQSIFLAETAVTRRDIKLWFVTWGRLRMAAGLKAKASLPETGPTAAEMTAALRRLAEEEGPDVPQTRFCVRTGWSTMLVHRRFGTYAALRESAGLSPRPRRKRRVTRQVLLEDVARVWVERGRPEPFLTYSQYVRDGCHSSHPIYEQFGSWPAVAEAVRAFVAAGDEKTDSGGVAAERSRRAE